MQRMWIVVLLSVACAVASQRTQTANWRAAATHDLFGDHDAALATLAIAASAKVPKQQEGRRLSSQSAGPVVTSWLLTAFYSDPTCNTLQAQYSKGYGLCYQHYYNGTALDSSYVSSLSTNLTTVYVTTQTYSDATCSVPFGSSIRYKATAKSKTCLPFPAIPGSYIMYSYPAYDLPLGLGAQSNMKTEQMTATNAYTTAAACAATKPAASTMAYPVDVCISIGVMCTSTAPSSAPTYRPTVTDSPSTAPSTIPTPSPTPVPSGIFPVTHTPTAAPTPCSQMITSASTTGYIITTYADNICSSRSVIGMPLVVTYGAATTCQKVGPDTTQSDNADSYETDYTIAASPIDPQSSSSSASCFAASETVQLEDGSVKALSEVQLGDRILTARLDGSAKGFSFSPVIAVPHAGEEQTAATFVLLSTAEKDIKMTADHLVLAGSCSTYASASPGLPLPLPLVQARSVSVGDCLQTAEGKTTVTAVRSVQGKGLSSAVTLAGDLIVVNGIVASPFALNHRIGDAWYVIHRALFTVLPAALSWTFFQKTSERFGDLAVHFSL